jgi:hypothetical protein
MVTIVDPVGSPSIYYNKSGQVYIDLTTPNSNTFATAVKITAVAGITVVTVNRGVSQSGSVYFDSDFQIGDRVEVVHDGTGGNISVYNSSGTLIEGLNPVGNNLYGSFILLPIGWWGLV